MVTLKYNDLRMERNEVWIWVRLGKVGNEVEDGQTVFRELECGPRKSKDRKEKKSQQRQGKTLPFDFPFLADGPDGDGLPTSWRNPLANGSIVSTTCGNLTVIARSLALSWNEHSILHLPFVLKGHETAEKSLLSSQISHIMLLALQIYWEVLVLMGVRISLHTPVFFSSGLFTSVARYCLSID